VKPCTGPHRFEPFNPRYKPINAQILNTKRRRWRVLFFDADSGAPIRLGTEKLPFITVSGAARYGVFIPLVPASARSDVIVGTERWSDYFNCRPAHSRRATDRWSDWLPHLVVSIRAPSARAGRTDVLLQGRTPAAIITDK